MLQQSILENYYHADSGICVSNLSISAESCLFHFTFYESNENRWRVNFRWHVINSLSLLSDLKFVLWSVKEDSSVHTHTHTHRVHILLIELARHELASLRHVGLPGFLILTICSVGLRRVVTSDGTRTL